MYILIAIALLAALTVSLVDSSSQSAQTQNTTRVISELKSQIQTIQAAVQECALTYPAGDPTIVTVDPGATDLGARTPYPIKPNSTHFTGQPIGPTSSNRLKDLRCPGNPGGTKNHALIFSGTTGKFLPPPVALFDDATNGEWRYYNGADGVFFYIMTNATDPYIAAALTKLDSEFAACEVDNIDATAAGVNITLDASPLTCVSGYRCLRYWMIRAATTTPACP